MDMNWRIIVEKESMEARGLTTDDFKIEVEVLSSAELADVLDTSDAVIGG
ncbi:MAG: DsrE family protein [Rhodospirillaceae bacterium]|nr:DsrE family protein [Rhodospirillaceae bacterium]